MEKPKKWQLIYRGDGTTRLADGTPVHRGWVYRRKHYTLVGSYPNKVDTDKVARGWRRQFGGALVRSTLLRDGKTTVYLIYATV